MKINGINMILTIILFLFGLVNFTKCCYFNETKTVISYSPTITQNINIIPTQLCSTNYIVSTMYFGECADTRRNQGGRCTTRYKTKTTSTCTSKTISNVYISPTSTPISIKQIYEYKLNCSNKSSSSLIRII